MLDILWVSNIHIFLLIKFQSYEINRYNDQSFDFYENIKVLLSLAYRRIFYSNFF